MQIDEDESGSKTNKQPQRPSPTPTPPSISHHTNQHTKQVSTPKSVLAPLAAAEPDLLAALPDDEVLALLLMAERRAGKRSFWWPYLRCVLVVRWDGCWFVHIWDR